MSPTRPILYLAATLAVVSVAWRAGAEPVSSDAPAPPVLRFAIIPQEPIPLPPVDDNASGERMTLAEAEAMALAYHPALREASGRVQAARGQWMQVGLPYNPTIGYQGSEIGDEGKAGQQGGFVSQEFITANKRGLSRNAASHEVAAAEQQLERVRLQIITATRLAYYEAVAAERAVKLARQLETIASQAKQAAELRLQALEDSRASLLQSQVEFESAAMLVDDATRRLDAAYRRLAALTGTATPLPLEDRLNDRLPVLTWESARDRVLAESPELAALRAEVERARWAVRRESAGRVPNVTLLGGVQLDHATNDTIAGAQFSLPLPVFDRNQGNITRACGELTAARAALERHEVVLTERLATAIRDYHTATRHVERYIQVILPAAIQARELVNQAYDQGESDYLALLVTQQTYTIKSLAYLQDLETAWKKWAEIDCLLVGLPGDDSD